MAGDDKKRCTRCGAEANALTAVVDCIKGQAQSVCDDSFIAMHPAPDEISQLDSMIKECNKTLESVSLLSSRIADPDPADVPPGLAPYVMSPGRMNGMLDNMGIELTKPTLR